MRGPLVLAFALIVLAPGCLQGEEVTTLPPPTQEELGPGFKHAEGAFNATSDVERVTWRSLGGDQAQIRARFDLEQGSVELRVLDDNNLVIFRKTFTDDAEGDAVTGRGRPGTWTVELDADNARGTWSIAIGPKEG